MIKKSVFNKIQLLLMFITAFVLFSSLYLQIVLGLQPCPLCLMQRICVFLLFALLGIGILPFIKASIVSVMELIISFAGLFFSLRQLWLQSLPIGQAPSCMPGLDVLIRYFPWQSIAKALFWGAGECAETSWEMWGISIAGWSALYFFVMVSVSASLCYFLYKESN